MPTPVALSAATDPLLSGAELATAFDGKLERVHLSLAYRLGILLVAAMMILMPVVYVAIIAGAALGVRWYALNTVGMLAYARSFYMLLFLLVAYVGPLLAGVMVILFMILPLFWRSKRGPKPLWIDRREQPLLYAYVDHLCDAMRVPRPARIDVIAAVNASAHIDNGLLGLVRRRLVLTIGLPFASNLTLKQFTGILAHEFGHFAQGSSMRLSYVVNRINALFARMAWGRSGMDDFLEGMASGGDTHWTFAMIIAICYLGLGIARLILKSLAIVSALLCRHLSRQAEFDADRRAARIVGSVAMEDGLQMAPFIAVAHSTALLQARQGWAKRTLPDDLIQFTDLTYLKMPDKTKDSITSKVLTADASWFDTHPPLFKRVAALKKAKLQGVLKLQAPATALFRDFPELCKLATLDFYQAILGRHLQPEHLYPTENLLPKPPKAPAPAPRQ